MEEKYKDLIEQLENKLKYVGSMNNIEFNSFLVQFLKSDIKNVYSRRRFIMREIIQTGKFITKDVSMGRGHHFNIMLKNRDYDSMPVKEKLETFLNMVESDDRVSGFSWETLNHFIDSYFGHDFPNRHLIIEAIYSDERFGSRWLARL